MSTVAYLKTSALKNPLDGDVVSTTFGGGETWQTTSQSMTFTDGTNVSSAVTVYFMHTSKFVYIYMLPGSAFSWATVNGSVQSTSSVPAACIPSYPASGYFMYINNGGYTAVGVFQISNTTGKIVSVIPSTLSGVSSLSIENGSLYAL
jgi:hypothetical protein